MTRCTWCNHPPHGPVTPHCHRPVRLPGWYPRCRRCAAVHHGGRWHHVEPADARAFLDAHQEDQ